jgi:hypothetical protein
MRRLILAAAVPVAALAVGATPAAAMSHKTCKADNAGNWEVKLGRETTLKRAESLRARAAAKRLHVTLERDGCGKRWEVGVTASTKAKATAMLRTTRRDGFRSVTIEKS